jgi:ADP-ribose pyrophosphatase YjhB (NUDIX family)
MDKRFNIRVYGLLINEEQKVLISKEKRFGKSFTKFPGGGLEWGEGIIECLKREFMEELGIEIWDLEHFYTTDFFQESAFRKGDQLVSIYYKVKAIEGSLIQNGFSALDIKEGEENNFFWWPIQELDESFVTYPIDKLIVQKLLAN